MSNLERVARAHKYCVIEQCNVNKQMAADVRDGLMGWGLPGPFGQNDWVNGLLGWGPKSIWPG